MPWIKGTKCTYLRPRDPIPQPGLQDLPSPSPKYPSLTKEFLLILGAHHVPLSFPLPSTVIARACLSHPLIFPKYHKPTRVCFHFPGIISSPSIPHNPSKNKAKQSLLIPTEKHPLTQGPSSLEWRIFFFSNASIYSYLPKLNKNNFILNKKP